MKAAPAFTHSGFFAMRTALLPFDEFLNWSRGLAAAEAAARGQGLEAALDGDRRRLRDVLRSIIARPVIREALFVASPSLDESVGHWLDDPASPRGQKVERTLIRYFSRMAGRATPFGLFAGCSVGRIGDQTILALEAAETYQRHTRLDMEYLFALVEGLVRDSRLRSELIFRPNSTLYRAAGRIRYAESRFNGQERSHHLVAVEATDYLDATLDRAASGARATDLAAALVSDDITLAEAAEYVGELIDSQLLVADLGPPVTGPEPIHALIDRLAAHSVAAEVVDCLRQTRDALDTIDGRGLGIEPAAYRGAAELLQRLPPRLELARLFQVDMVKPASEAVLGQAVLDEIVRGVEVLTRLCSPPSEDSLARFRSAYQERYGDRELPLIEVLDEEVGIGFERSLAPDAEAAPLLQELAFPSTLSNQVTWGPRETFLLRKLTDALVEGADQIELTADDLKQLDAETPAPLPDAFAMMATVVAESQPALAADEFRVLLGGGGGPSGARLLGRFCHSDPDLNAAVIEHLRAEESLQPEAAFAEVVHLPEGRIGNVLSRPVLREYEIPYLGHSGAPAERKLPITDLLVSVAGQRIRLRSRRLGREVVPRLSTAHNYGWNSLGVYKFLCQLQGQGAGPWLHWSWGPLESSPFLPRVTAGRLVLSRARWTLSRPELQTLGKQRGAEVFRAVQSLRARRRLPRFVSLADSDNELPVDLDNVLCVETLVDLVKGRPSATLIEVFPGPHQLIACGPEGRFVHELVIPFVRTKEESRKERVVPLAATSAPPRALDVKRDCPPGSEWLYVKLYTGTATADQLLRDMAGPVARRALEIGAADYWFFIRYSDPQWHLRVRLHGDPVRLRSDVLPLFEERAAELLASGQAWRIEVATYEREIERYGGVHGIELAERIFHADSEAALQLIENCPGDAGLDARWRLTLRGIDALLDDFGFDLAAKRTIVGQARAGFAAEFRADAGLQHQLSRKFRSLRQELEALLDRRYDAESLLAPGLAILQERSLRLAPWLTALKAAEDQDRLTTSLVELTPSFIHMHINRVLRSAQRAQELVLYDFLDRLYQSQAARRQ